MRPDLITVNGETDGTSTTGVFTLRSEAFTNTPNYIRIDKHIKAKIWARRVCGKPVIVKIEYTRDYTDWSSPTVLDVIVLSSEGEIDLEKRKPLIVVGRTGREAIRFTWDQTAWSAGKSYISFDIEFEPLE